MTGDELLALSEHDPDEAARLAIERLNRDHQDVVALFVLGTVHQRAEHNGLAAALFHRIAALRPHQANAWNNYGLAVAGTGDYAAARKSFFEAWNLERSPAAAANIAMAFLNESEYRKALEWADRSIAMKPDGPSAKTTRGMAKLALGDWSGWGDNAASVGGKFRKLIQYTDEPQWDGKPVTTLVAYGEQGLGDEVMYASCLQDAKTRAERLIVECDPRLQGLFRRSFPWAEVHGTRRMDEVAWLEGLHVDASVPVGRLPEFFRPTPQSCPGKPYLVADPERRTQWRALFDSWGKRPKIGIAWSGGSRHNHPEARAIGLEAFRPLIEAVDADWISLQYRDPTAEIEATGLPVRHFKRATLTDDYDDTAGLVAELDCVIGVHTSVHHLAGALGVRGLILVPPQSIWLYAMDEFPWYSSASLFKQRGHETWAKTMERLVDDPFVRGL